MLSVSIVDSFFGTEPTDIILMYNGKTVGQSSCEPGEANLLPAVQLLMCATAKKLIGDLTKQYSYLKNSVPAITNDTWWDIKTELQQHDTAGHLEHLQPWLRDTMEPLLTKLVPTHQSPTARNMQKKHEIIRAIAAYTGTWSAKIPQEDLSCSEPTRDGKFTLQNSH